MSFHSGSLIIITDVAFLRNCHLIYIWEVIKYYTFIEEKHSDDTLNHSSPSGVTDRKLECVTKS